MVFKHLCMVVQFAKQFGWTRSFQLPLPLDMKSLKEAALDDAVELFPLHGRKYFVS